MKQHFSSEELLYLTSRGYDYLDKTDNYVSKTEYNGFGYSIVKIKPDGGVEYKSSKPDKIDVDTGDYDIKYIYQKYNSFDDFKNNNPYYSKEY